MNAPALVMALFNGAWQGTLLCLAVIAILRFYRGLNAATRYAIWSAVLGIVLILPVANYAFSVRPVTQTETYSVAAPSPRIHFAAQATALTAAAPREIPPKLQPYQIVIHDLAQLAQYARFALYALALMILIRVVFLGREIIRMIAARAAVAPIDAPFELHDSVRRAYEFAASSSLSMPCVLGFQPALIVIPDVLLETGGRDELLSVVLHEHEHVMRFDDVQNVIHRLAGAVGFFLPGVALALRELAVYREQICDDAAIAGMGNRYAYARTLSAMAQWMQSSPAPVPCFIFKRKQLLRRIEVLLDTAVSHSLRPNLRFAAVTIAALAVIAVVSLRWQVPVFAERVAISNPGVVASHIATRHAPRVAPGMTAQTAPKLAPKIASKTVKAVQEKRVVVKSEKIQRAPTVMKAHLHMLAARLANAPAMNAVLAERVARTTAGVARRDGSGDLLDALAKAGYNNLSVDELIALRDNGVSPRLVEGAAAYFGPRLNVNSLVYLARQGISGDYLSELTANGVPGLSPEDVVKLLDHGVSLSTIAGARAYFGTISSGDLVTLADQGVSSSYLIELHDVGVRGLSAADVAKLMDHGVSPGLISALRARGYNPTMDDLIRLADNGVTPQFIASLSRLGNRHLSINDIIRLRDAGF